MQNDTYSVEVIGFTDTEQTVLNSVFGLSARRVPKYVRHTPADGMPNIFLVDSNDEAAVKQLGVRNAVGDIQVVLIGDNTCGTNWALLARPIRWMKLFQAFDAIVGAVPPAAAPTSPADTSQSFAKPNLVTLASLTASIDAKAPPPVVVVTREALLEKIAATTAKMQSFNPAAEMTSENVLVVDDNLTVREFMRNKLSAFSFNVDYAETGEQAIGLTGQKQYSCVFLDVVMPGIDGYQVCKLIKANRSAKKTTVVMLTSKSSPFDKIRGAMSGCDAYLTKPVDEEKLVETIAKYLSVDTKEAVK
ncbi:MAG: response regulator [Gallionella sp.]|nr:response regulator [Gallionella sp.]